MALATAAGDLRHVVSIQSRAPGEDSFGGEIMVWTTIMTGVRCKKVPVSGREQMRAAAEYSEVRTRFRLRYREGISPDMRVVEASGITHEIISVINIDGLNRELELLTKAYVD